VTDGPLRARDRSESGDRASNGARPPVPPPLPVPVVDSHCHLDISDGDYWLDVDTALESARQANIVGIVQVGCDVPGSRWAADVASKYANVHATVALHPNEAPRIHAEGGLVLLEAAWAEIEKLAALPQVRGIGETGLDFFRTPPEGRGVQEESFRRHIAWAKKYDKVLVIHDRDAHDDVVRVLLDEGAPDKVIFHCFSGTESLARTCAQRGWYMSFAGTVTFKSAHELRDALRAAPQELLLVETDAPYLTPTPHRGRTNASYLIPWTVRVMAETRNEDVSQLAGAIFANSTALFGTFTPS
jgi:TatD DNase family protein